jgi:hypothetical protein
MQTKCKNDPRVVRDLYPSNLDCATPGSLRSLIVLIATAVLATTLAVVALKAIAQAPDSDELVLLNPNDIKAYSRISCIPHAV